MLICAFCHIEAIDACPLSLKLWFQNPTASIILLFLPSTGVQACSWSRWPSWEDSEDPAHSLKWWSSQPPMGFPVNSYKWPGPWGIKKKSAYKIFLHASTLWSNKSRRRVMPTWHDSPLLVEGLLKQRLVLPHCIKGKKIYSVVSNSYVKSK